MHYHEAATEKLRSMLDERGVKWHGVADSTYWGEVLLTKHDGSDPVYKFKANKIANKLSVHLLQITPEQAVEATLGQKVTGQTSDGYHTFDELYHHRAVLFSVIVANHRGIAWKARKHHDGTMYEGMFIVGIETPWGQASYHYDLDPYWGMFDCRELDQAPEWDGHTPDEAIERIGKLATLGRGTCHIEERHLDWYCTGCGDVVGSGDPTDELYIDGNAVKTWNYCPNCGRKVE